MASQQSALRTLHISNVPYEVLAKELAQFLEGHIGAVAHCELKSKNYKWRHDGYGFVQFDDRECCEDAIAKAACQTLVIKNTPLRAKYARRDMKLKPKYDPTRLDEGKLYVGCLMSPTKLGVLWSPVTKCVTVEFDFDTRMLRLLTQLEGPVTGYGREKWEYKMEFPFRFLSSVEPVTTGHGSQGTKGFLIQPWNPPRLFKRQLEGAGPEVFMNLLGLNTTQAYIYHRDEPEQLWVRTVDFTPRSSIGQSFAYCVELPTVNNQVYKNILKRCEEFHISWSRAPVRHLTIEPATTFARLDSMIVPILRCPHLSGLPFEILFLLHQLIQNGHVSGPCLTLAFYAMLYPEGCQMPAALEGYVSSQLPGQIIQAALTQLYNQTEVCYNPIEHTTKQFEGFIRRRGQPGRSNAIELDEGQMRVHRLLVTPTKGIFSGPEIDISNRVTRQYVDCIDSFLRVSFVEEDYDFLPSSALSVPLSGGAATGLRPDRSDIYRRISGFMRDGFRFGGKTYQFLAFSSSQLREQSLWMFSGSEHGITTQEIREWMGDFLNIRNVAECAARMGQCFSSSTPTLEVPKHEVEHLDDIVREYGGVKYCFSDGIGKISLRFATEVAAKCGPKTAGKVPSAFQIRYGGYKGVVAVDLRSSRKLSLRNSMKKFPSQHIGLEVLSCTRVIPCYLNRQVISLLSTLQVPDDVFEEIQRNVIKQLLSMQTEAAVALEVLEVASSGHNHVANMELLRAGFPPHEPFLYSVLGAFSQLQLVNLRTKSRILVPKGRCLMGCLDELAVLQYGQVFVQVSPTPGNRYYLDDGLRQFPSYRGFYRNQNPGYVVKGMVVVAKNPCVHPGDVRVLEAVDVPQLHHMIDCVVFPQLGARPHPNECSGSDLDGDLYFVSWDPRLVPSSADAPMHYTPAPKIQLDHSVTVEEIQQFFLDHMVNDSLGVISNAHVVHADKSHLKARDPKCLELAKLLSIALNFPKTGAPAVMPTNLRPEEYPDFMEKHEKSYVSDGVLGKLYRAVRSASTEQPSPQITKARIVRAFDKSLVAEGYEDYLEEAVFLKSEYDARLIALMNQYGIMTEAELVSGNIVTLSRHYKRRQGDVKQRIMFAVQALRKQAKGWFHHGYYGEDYEDDQAAVDPQAVVAYISKHDTYAKASAWYYVTYHADHVNEPPYFLSFPWLMHDKLIALKTLAKENDPCNQM